MARILGPRENFKVVVTPDAPWHYKGATRAAMDEAWWRKCIALESDIKRHCDDVADITITYDEPKLCEHCGATWTETSSDYNGGCCAQDLEDQEKRELPT